MTVVLIVLHVIVCVFLVAVVLLQRGKGAEIGAVFGGGASSTVFGSRGAGTFLSKLTTASAVLFMLTSLSLSYIYTQGSGDRLFEDGVEQEEAVEESVFEELGTVAPDADAGLDAGADAAAPASDVGPEASEPATEGAASESP